MKRLVAILLLAIASAVAQPLPPGVTVFIFHESGAVLGTFLPLPAPLISMDQFEVFVSTTNQSATGFIVRILVTSGDITTEESLTIDRTDQEEALAEFWVPAGAAVRLASVVELDGAGSEPKGRAQ